MSWWGIGGDEIMGDHPADVPPLGDWDLLAAWLCQRPRCGLMGGEAFGLFDLIDALEAADEDERFTLEWDEVRPFRDVPSRAKRTSLRSGLRAWQRGRRELGSLKERPFFARFIQTEDRLKHLLELDKTLP